MGGWRRGQGKGQGGGRGGGGMMYSPSCVIQMEPLPMPTLKASTPALIRFSDCATVTTVVIDNNIYKMLSICLLLH